jgi:two-component system chemotaxis sensor kinase CheA
MQGQSVKLSTIEQSLQNKQNMKDTAVAGQTVISVKVDNLMDLVGELVIAEAMVTQNPEINNILVESF